MQKFYSLAVLALLAAGVACTQKSAEAPAQMEPGHEHEQMQASAPAAGYSVKGTAVFAGKESKAETVKMNADPKCLAQYKDGFKYKPVVVGQKGELSNVFVYVKSGLQGQTFDAPKEPAVVLDQKGCWYHPRVMGIMVGQKLEIRNSDPTMHNVNASPEFNAAMPATVKMMEKTFKSPKVMFKIKCNVHPWMTAYVGVLGSPYFAVTGDNGQYEIKNLPAGKYTLEFWHEKLGTSTQEVTVTDAGATANVKFSAKGTS
ncbi:MAG: carboxypeptidase regulatory-like domain-containing protein [Elusimicrobia bacterium]|nr:carboxypeptidase regulatory-like domain-containing protein [Elusimicrobiota bacterium]